MFLGLIFTMLIPETKNRALEEMEQVIESNDGQVRRQLNQLRQRLIKRRPINAG